MNRLGTLWNQAGELLLKILNLFYGLTHSYGIAIILLTILVRVVLHPLNQKQLVSMQKMQKIQPRIKTLQEKYGHDKQKLNEETMKLYKENQVNPAAGLSIIPAGTVYSPEGDAAKGVKARKWPLSLY